jgi:MYXO-CTERM domain-containing protein
VIHWQEDTLTRGALLSVPGNPRRALELGDELLAVSDSNVRSFSDDGAMTADLVIGACVPRYGTGDGNWPGGGWPEEGGEYHGHDYYRGCRAAGGGANPVALLTLILGLLVVGRRR